MNLVGSNISSMFLSAALNHTEASNKGYIGGILLLSFVCYLCTFVISRNQEKRLKELRQKTTDERNHRFKEYQERHEEMRLENDKAFKQELKNAKNSRRRFRMVESILGIGIEETIKVFKKCINQKDFSNIFVGLDLESENSRNIEIDEGNTLIKVYLIKTQSGDIPIIEMIIGDCIALKTGDDCCDLMQRSEIELKEIMMGAGEDFLNKWYKEKTESASQI